MEKRYTLEELQYHKRQLYKYVKRYYEEYLEYLKKYYEKQLTQTLTRKL